MMCPHKNLYHTNATVCTTPVASWTIYHDLCPKNVTHKIPIPLPLGPNAKHAGMQGLIDDDIIQGHMNGFTLCTTNGPP